MFPIERFRWLTGPSCFVKGGSKMFSRYLQPSRGQAIFLSNTNVDITFVLHPCRSKTALSRPSTFPSFAYEYTRISLILTRRTFSHFLIQYSHAFLGPKSQVFVAILAFVSDTPPSFLCINIICPEFELQLCYLYPSICEGIHSFNPILSFSTLNTSSPSNSSTLLCHPCSSLTALANSYLHTSIAIVLGV